jgi:hypothetical protein
VRIVLQGTEKKLVKPSNKDLALPDWNKSYLEWVDLSGSTLPPMEDADILHYKATDTVFRGRLDYCQFCYPIDISTAVFPEEMSSYSYDFVIEVIRRRALELKGVDDKASELGQACYDYLLEGYAIEPYKRSWYDTYWMLMDRFGLTLDDVNEQIEPVFKPFPRMVDRLRQHHRFRNVGSTPGNKEQDWSRVRLMGDKENRDTDLTNIKPVTATDRYLSARYMEVLLEQRFGVPFDCWFSQFIPTPTLFPIARNHPHGEEWWRRTWPS